MRREQDRVTIRDVAEKAGVSIGTASRVVNGRTIARPELRAAVLTAVEALGYRAGTFGAGRSGGGPSCDIVGCIVRDINIPSLAAFVRAAHETLEKAGYTFVISNSEGARERELELIRSFSRERLDGLMLGAYTPMDLEFETALLDFRAPLLLIDRDTPRWADCILVDHRSSTRAAVGRLIGLGHRRIALLTGAPKIFPANERVRGYRDAFEAAGLPVEEGLIRASSFLRADGFRLTIQLLEAAKPPTAIIAGGLDLLSGVLRAVRTQRLAVPADISIVGAGESELAEFHTPAISVQRWDQEALGRRAAAMLLQRMGADADAPPVHADVAAEFVERGSIGPPRG
ncbi:substrate-binding domain-containing protein [Acuticoccus sp. M5D2P5]|uniref:substrate-binding domain-containing protein n=1 Tax=Acuticoccus kalidii TaxID=2910977 RepID=UPI001F4286C9|nr:substrate-binding domain-containing protein [Acuticoccus kalidii]MCF3935064.1 substrate-binding domain-containing protein [Acuticoccus kalidii]